VFGGFCLLLFLPCPFFPFRGVVLFFGQIGFWLLGQISLIAFLGFVWRV
jgi:hypothetical protein